MATKHWGRDAYFDDPLGTYGGNQIFAGLLLYNMMRAAGFELEWECDGEVGPGTLNANHCDDGNMRVAGVGAWASVGSPPTKEKSTTHTFNGPQSLKIVTDAPGEGVQSNALLSITNPNSTTIAGTDTLGAPDATGCQDYYDAGGHPGKDLTNCRVTAMGFGAPGNNGTFYITDPYFNLAAADKHVKWLNPGGANEFGWVPPPPPYPTLEYQRRYEIFVWAYNVAGGAWDVKVDPGNGTPITVGTIPVDAGGWKRYHFSFWAVSSGSRYIYITDPVGGRTIYIGGVMVFRSSFEYAPTNVYGTDGILTNPDRFSTGGSYVASYKDIGKWLFVWDEVNHKNSGYYKITADLGGGVVQVDMRSGTATFTSTSIPANPLNWRIVDIEGPAHNDGMPAFQVAMGFGLRSPHASGWRMFMRFNGTTGASGNKWWTVWVAPNNEATFDLSTGIFDTNGPSSIRNLENAYSYRGAANLHCWQGLYLAGGTFRTRDWFMTDQNRSFITFVHINAALSMHSCFVIGYTGADVDHPGIEEFVNLMAFDTGGTSSTEIGWGGAGYFTYTGVGFAPDGTAVFTGSPLLGYGNAAACVLTQSNGGPNPWSGKEWVHPLIIERDPSVQNGCPSERDSDIGIYCCRNTLTNMATFDSNNFLHFLSILAWEWSGEAII